MSNITPGFCLESRLHGEEFEDAVVQIQTDKLCKEVIVRRSYGLGLAESYVCERQSGELYAETIHLVADNKKR